MLGRAKGAVVPVPVVVGDAARAQLLSLARIAIAVASRAVPAEALEAAMREEPATELCASAFVSLSRGGQLRGCMGVIDPQRLVVESVAEAAACATRTDPRFPPVTPDELPGLEVNVSVLGPFTPVADKVSWRLGTDGVVVQMGGRRGLLLPEVAEENRLDRLAMLDTATRKAGLPNGGWRDPSARVFAFRTDRFGGPVLAEDSPPEPSVAAAP
jgi:AmmeMemoRadiSam system protein A